MTFSTRNFDPISLKHTVAVVTHAHVLHNFYTITWVRGVACQKQRLGSKLDAVWSSGASKKVWTAIIISATVEASNFHFGTQLGFGPKLAGVWARGASKKFGTPY